MPICPIIPTALLLFFRCYPIPLVSLHVPFLWILPFLFISSHHLSFLPIIPIGVINIYQLGLASDPAEGVNGCMDVRVRYIRYLVNHSYAFSFH